MRTLLTILVSIGIPLVVFSCFSCGKKTETSIPKYQKLYYEGQAYEWGSSKFYEVTIYGEKYLAVDNWNGHSWYTTLYPKSKPVEDLILSGSAEAISQ